MNKGYIYKRRLLRLADFLDNLPEEKFDISSWVDNDWKGRANLSCGSTACSLGWAATIPAFRKAGLVMKRNKYDSNFKFIPVLKDMPGNIDNTFIAGKEIFGLSRGEFNHLFVPEYALTYNATPKQAAEHIRNFVLRKYGK